MPTLGLIQYSSGLISIYDNSQPKINVNPKTNSNPCNKLKHVCQN